MANTCTTTERDAGAFTPYEKLVVLRLAEVAALEVAEAATVRALREAVAARFSSGKVAIALLLIVCETPGGSCPYPTVSFF